VQNLVSLIEKKMPKAEDGKIHEWLGLIQNICQRNISLIGDLIHQEFLESAEMEISKERLDSVWEINEVIINYKNAQEKISKVFELTYSQERIFAQVDSIRDEIIIIASLMLSNSPMTMGLLKSILRKMRMPLLFQ
jgi:hypothetical protein